MALCPGATESEFHKRAGGKKADAAPASITQSAHQVVVTALAALKKRSKPTIISGLPNRVMATFTRFVPRKEVVTMMGSVR
jgi:short-subunit dehydrogenase